MTSFVQLNQCSDAELTADLLDRIAAAYEVQLNRDFAPHWGGNYRVRAATPGNPPAPGEVVSLIVDELPSAPQAVAFHDWEGKPEIYIARNMCSSLILGEGSLSQAGSHEHMELPGDPGCNLWADTGTGEEWAHELCDAVESNFYEIDGIAVSDFLLPEWFNVGGTATRYSFMGNAPAPFTLATGGYTVRRLASTSLSTVEAFWPIAVSVTATIPFGRRLEKKRHWSSRTWRRGARLIGSDDVPTDPQTPLARQSAPDSEPSAA